MKRFLLVLFFWSCSGAVAQAATASVSWGASTDEAGGSGIGGYELERCMGAGCLGFVKIATVTVGTSYSDMGLLPLTSYSWRIRAFDKAGNKSGYTNVATVTTPKPPDITKPSVPGAVVVVVQP